MIVKSRVLTLIFKFSNFYFNIIPLKLYYYKYFLIYLIGYRFIISFNIVLFIILFTIIYL